MNMHQCDIFYINMPEFLWGPPWPPPTPELWWDLREIWPADRWGVWPTWCTSHRHQSQIRSLSLPGGSVPIHVIYIRCNQLRFLQLWLDCYTRSYTWWYLLVVVTLYQKMAEDSTICESAAKLRWVQSTVRPWEGPRSVCILFTFHSLS